MYFNNNNGTSKTNIDNEFKDKKNKSSKTILIGIVITIILIAIILFIVFKFINTTTYTIELLGENEISIYLNDEYIEPGYIAKDNHNNDLTDKVSVNNTIDTSTIGTYKIIYTLDKTEITRTINVIEKPAGATVIFLMGKTTIYLKVGEAYNEPGYAVIDSVDGNLQDKVITTGSVNTNTPGIYKITYSVTNNGGITTSKQRTIVVTDSDISLTTNTTNYTNKEVFINIYVMDNYFDYLILPNNEKTTKKEDTYKVSKNGTYKFTIYNKLGNSLEKEITITNIDKEPPTASCTGTYGNGKSNITIKANDNIGINKYVIDNNTYTEKAITLNKELSTVSITIYDLAGNTKSISCNLKKLSSSQSSSSKPSSSSSAPELDGWILIGDSRTTLMRPAIQDIKPSNFYITAKGGAKYDYLIKTGIPDVNDILNKNPGKRFYILNNLGANDYNPNYANTLNKLANGDWKNHQVIFVSANPYGGPDRAINSQIDAFNQDQKKQLSGVYYCDTFNGIGIGNFECKDKDDCLHYNNNTYIKIYNYIVNNCKF